MRPVTVDTSISAPREDVFDYVADMANRVAWTDHYLQEFRLARANPLGLGAAARFRLDAPFAKVWVEVGITECDRPRRIVEEGRWGRIGRSRLWTVYEFSAEAGGVTEVELTTATEPATRLDALRESLGARRWLRRQSKAALERLRMVFEEERDAPLARATVAAFEPAKAARFGL
jgi:uncharacterized protein YndB with AHSA1/START domain